MKGALKFIKSWQGLLWLGMLWVFLYVGLAIWMADSFAYFTTLLGSNILVQAPFVLFLIMLLWQVGAGFVRRLSEEGLMRALLWVVLPCGIAVYLAGFFLNAVFMDTGALYTVLGDRIRPPWEDRAFVVTEIRAELAGEIVQDTDTQSSLLLKVEPKVAMNDNTGRAYEVGVFPPVQIGSTYYHIMDFGLAPGIRLLDSQGKVMASKYIIQRVFPPGVSDSFSLPMTDYTVTLTMAPVREVRRAGQSVALYEPLSNHYDIRIDDGQSTLYEGRYSGGQIDLAGLKLQLHKPAYWVRIEAARAPGYMVFAAGVALCALGLVFSGLYVALKSFGTLKALRKGEFKGL